MLRKFNADVAFDVPAVEKPQHHLAAEAAGLEIQFDRRKRMLTE
jgi:hypothetical protein